MELGRAEVHMNEMDSAAQGICDLNQEYINTYRLLIDTLRDTKDWKGTDSESFMIRTTEFEKSFNALSDSIDKVAAFIAAGSKAYKKVQMELLDAVSLIKLTEVF